MKPWIAVAVVAVVPGLTGCVAPRASSFARVDEVPMYGGMDRSTFPELKAADEKFIADVSVASGSRDKAARVWIEQGYRFYRQDQLGMAMRRFNQAWLLDPANAEVYAGFGAVLSEQRKSCEAMAMMDRALALNPPSFQGIYADAALTIARCAVSNDTHSLDAKNSLLGRSEAIFKRAEDIEPDKAYVYGAWAAAYYRRGQYRDACTMVAKERSAGGKPSAAFLALLNAKMPEPGCQ